MNTLIILLVIVGLLYLLFLFWANSLKKKWTVGDIKFFHSNWKKIRAITDHKLAVMEADKLLDQMLRKRGFKGSLGEKLKQGKSIFSDNNAVWSAHKVRNKLAHELDYKLQVGEFARAMDGFEGAFRDLGLK